MTEKEKQELLEISEVAYKAYALTLETASAREQQFIAQNRDMFICIFNRIVLMTKRLLNNEKIKP
ncbi:MAG: hypothetical protein HDR71_17990 [Lachnospiraceae bacterium]|nr:hypothetical protein [Lachnospiraceae bacterium]